jgi:hypothetical protein
MWLSPHDRLDPAQEIPERSGLTVKVERENEEARVAQLPACACTQEPAKLIDEASVAPCGLPLERAKRREVSLLRQYRLNGVGSDRANELVFQVAVANEEPLAFEVTACIGLRVASPRQFTAEVPLFGSIAQAADAQSDASRPEAGKEPRHRPSAADRYHDHAFFRQVSRLEACQSLDCNLIADTLDQHNGMSVLNAFQCSCGCAQRSISPARVSGNRKLPATASRAANTAARSLRHHIWGFTGQPSTRAF